MITEPELTGGPEEPAPDVISGGDRGPGRDAAVPPGRRPWLWGIGGLALASAAWAGGLHAYHLHHHSAGPDLHGYVLGDSPCAGTTLRPLTDALKSEDAEAVSPAAVQLGPALDQLRCTISASSNALPGGVTHYEAFVTVDLHKKTDPRPEFDDQSGLDTSDLTAAESTRRIGGLGDEAYLLTLSDQTQELKVLHGGAVFTLTLTDYNSIVLSPVTGAAGTPRPQSHFTRDPARFRPALVAAMRNVMNSQRKHP